MDYNEYYQAVKKGLADYLLGNGINSEEELENYMKSQEDCIKNDFDLHIREYKEGKFSASVWEGCVGGTVYCLYMLY